jgi:hypothetical protein
VSYVAYKREITAVTPSGLGASEAKEAHAMQVRTEVELVQARGKIGS